MIKKSITKKVIANSIYKRFGKSLKKRIINDALSTICKMLTEGLEKDRAVSVENFGTLSPFTFHGHGALNVATGEMCEVKPFRSVKFRSHAAFLTLLLQRRATFTDTGKKEEQRLKKKTKKS